MKINLIIKAHVITLLLVLFCTHGEENGWKSGMVKQINNTGGSIKISDAVTIVKYSGLKPKKHEVQIYKPLTLDIDCTYKLSFQAETKNFVILEIVYGTATEPYGSYARKRIAVTPDKTNYEVDFKVNESEGKAYDPKREHVIRIYFGDNDAVDLKMSKLSINQAINFKENWKVFANVRAPESYNVMPEYLSSLSGEKVSPIDVKLKNNLIDLAKFDKQKLSPGKIAVVYNELISDKNKIIKIGFAADWWMEVYVNGKLVYSTIKSGNVSRLYQPSDHIVDIPVNAGDNLVAVKVLSGSEGWKFACGAPPVIKQKIATRQFIANDKWKPVDLSSLQVIEGSALDLSSLIEAPSGKYGRMIVNNNGNFAFKEKSEIDFRMRGFNGVPRDVWQYNSDEEFKKRAVLFAKAARRQGYSHLRTNMLECALTSKVDKDYTFNIKYLDRWDYLFSKLKEEGVYIQLVLVSYGFYYSPFSFESEIFKDRNKNKLLLVLSDENVRKHVKFGVNFLLNHVNPYTGMAWKDDPSIFLVEYVNEHENGVRKMHQIIESDKNAKTLAVGLWHNWVENKLAGKDTNTFPPEFSKRKLSEVDFPKRFGNSEKLDNLYVQFISYLSQETMNWFENIVRSTGYSGLVTSYNFSKKLNFSAIRWKNAQVTIINNYFSHPYSNEVDQKSSVENTADYIRTCSASNLAGRPFIVTEINHSFWNKYQHEAGIVYGSYAALQNFSSLTIHSSPVLLKYDKRALGAFSAGASPISRAGEFISGCLFLRGDVCKAKNIIDIKITDQFLMSGINADKPINGSQSKLSLISGLRISFPDIKIPKGLPEKTASPTLVISPEQGGKISGSEWFTNVIDINDDQFSERAFIKKLKEMKLLSEDNITKTDEGVYQSDTGEIVMRSREKSITVITARTEAATVLADRSVTLHSLKNIKSEINASVAVCSMDHASISKSRKMVLVYSTEVANSGMELSYNHEKMINTGTAPVLMKTGKLVAELVNSNSGQPHLFPLNFDGSRRNEIPCQRIGDKITISINTSILKNGPTPFFELVIE